MIKVRIRTVLAAMTLLSITPALLILCVYCFTCAYGLECYSCGHIDGIDSEYLENFFHKSCKNGKKPDKKFVTTCKESAGEDSCGKLYFEGGAPGISNNVKVTFRGCIPTIEEFDGKCGKPTIDELRNDTRVPEGYRELLKNFNGNQSGTICSCKSNKCNTGTVVHATNVLIFCFALAVSKFAGTI